MPWDILRKAYTKDRFNSNSIAVEQLDMLVLNIRKVAEWLLNRLGGGKLTGAMGRLLWNDSSFRCACLDSALVSNPQIGEKRELSKELPEK